mmetsp:Transcript_17191/g.32538  ORF Transcript_17191/g.32538 Transcript_17191/m.32538 type:complete len:107 (+) Transcript_17191:124-444(+)
MAPVFLGGKLKLKGEKKKKKSKHKLDEKVNRDAVTKASVKVPSDDEDVELTEAEKKGLQLQKEREKLEIERLAKQSHRERVEEFNEKLGNLTEHNDIPRISAAGNG